MKATPHNIAILRSLIRWSTGAVVTTGIISGTIFLFPPLGSSLPALGLTSFLSVLIGLKIGFPPICPEDDWVCIGTLSDKAAGEETATTRERQPNAATQQKPEPFGAPAQAAFKQDRPSRMQPAPIRRVANGDFVPSFYKFDSPIWRLAQAQNSRQRKGSGKLSHN